MTFPPIASYLCLLTCTSVVLCHLPLSFCAVDLSLTSPVPATSICPPVLLISAPLAHSQPSPHATNPSLIMRSTLLLLLCAVNLCPTVFLYIIIKTGFFKGQTTFTKGFT